MRGCEHGEVVLTTYGRSSGFCVDPIEKKPLNHFLPGTTVLSFGTAGCNLGCKFCQNWDMSKSREMDTLADEASPEHHRARAAELGCRSVAFTYNDPVIFMEYAIDVARACRARGCQDRGGNRRLHVPEPRREFFEHMDAANVDLKGFTEEFYQRSAARAGAVLDTLEYIKQRDRTCGSNSRRCSIPGENDSDAELDANDAVGGRASRSRCAAALHRVSSRLEDDGHAAHAVRRRWRAHARSQVRNGLRYVYTGNVHDPNGGSTYCHGCGERLIERDWYRLGAWRLTADGRCARCGVPCAGRFDATPGAWGARRMPVRLADFEAGQ